MPLETGTLLIEIGHDGLPQEFDCFAFPLLSGQKIHVWRCRQCGNNGYALSRRIANVSRRIHAQFCRRHHLAPPPLWLDPDRELYRKFCPICRVVTERCLECGSCLIHERCRHLLRA